jgi:carbamate kinase
MESGNGAQRLKRRYERLAARLAALGPIVQGTITARTITKEDPQYPGQTKTIGPYYQWTFKRNAKTVTVNLSAQQSKHFRKAIDNNHKAETLLAQMRELSVEILNATTQGVAKRNRSK